MQNFKINILKNPEELGEHIANKVFKMLKQKRNTFVLGVPWGSSPIPFFNSFSKLVKKHNTDLSKMHLIMMDEYVKDRNNYSYVPKDGPYCGHYKLENDFLVKLPTEQAQKINVHFPDSANPENFDKFIKNLGGVDLFLVATGAEDGHVAICGPATPLDSRTRILQLPEAMREYNFKRYIRALKGDKNNMPRYAVSVGLKTILDSRKLLFIAHGNEKARIIEIFYKAKKFDKNYPITFLWKAREKTELCIDKAAAQNIVDLVKGE